MAGKVVSGFLEQKKLRGSREGDALTDREREVLLRVAQGYSNKEVAGQLTVSVKTVESHRANLMAKLGLHTRAEIVRHALQQGWLAEQSFAPGFGPGLPRAAVPPGPSIRENPEGVFSLSRWCAIGAAGILGDAGENRPPQAS